MASINTDQFAEVVTEISHNLNLQSTNVDEVVNDGGTSIVEKAEFFNVGCLLILNTSVWGARKKLPKDKVKIEGGAIYADGLGNDIENEDKVAGDVNKNYISATKSLINRKYLKQLEAIRSRAWGYLYDKRRSLDLGIPGMIYIPKDNIPMVNDTLEKMRDEFMDLVDDFVANYEDYIEEAKHSLKSEFYKTQYPSVVDMRDKFKFEWKYFVVQAPGEEANILPPNLYIEAQNKFDSMLLDASESAVKALRCEFQRLLGRLLERIKGDTPMNFKRSSVDNLVSFMDAFKTMNITNDKELESLIERTKDLVQGVDAKDIRSDDQLRHYIADGMGIVNIELSALTEKSVRAIMI